ncbi:GTPase Obg [Mucisphaera calidilacus]|uniref:GTPase Obg n=2 Tax=Mucisphaera calidilacus TaxID=2527982 RepID=A0A518BYA1_9BACT|nr:GTPase ObgE [Mucisphaera calidilacus]QDU71934.1 GTPase Obg [Mucisphaera calidilacus]
MFVDQAVIMIRSGKGGDGRVSFRREKYVAKGGPDGGDGGDGGSVVALAAEGVDTLMDFSGRHHWYAEDGEPGGSRDCDGKNGKDCVLRLPAGTVLYDDVTGQCLGDLVRVGDELVVAQGGKGGYGNIRFATPTNQVPREATPGEEAVERTLRLELRLIADVGLVGLPNAGKSTFLSSVSRATPKIANYPFTTLEPQLGIAEISGGRRMVIADLPGLIEGAAGGHGLGSRFLRHVERTRVLVHLISCESGDPEVCAAAYRTIRGELSDYSEALASKHEVVALSKTDLWGDDAPVFAAEVEGLIGCRVETVSSATRAGVGALLERVWPSLGRDAQASEGWGR